MTEQIGACPFCDAVVLRGAPRRDIWRFMLLPRITRTCVCFDAVQYSVQQALTWHTMPVCVLPVREVSKHE